MFKLRKSLLAVLALLPALTVAVWLSALNVRYRDVGYLLPFLAQTWLFVSPVAYSGNLMPGGAWGVLFNLNPMAGIIQLFRWALLGTQPPAPLTTLGSLLLTLVALLAGLAYFNAAQDDFADVV